MKCVHWLCISDKITTKKVLTVRKPSEYFVTGVYKFIIHCKYIPLSNYLLQKTINVTGSFKVFIFC